MDPGEAADLFGQIFGAGGAAPAVSKRSLAARPRAATVGADAGERAGRNRKKLKAK